MDFIRRSVNNPVAANMLMVLLLFGGLLAAAMIPRELFPEFSVDIITVSVPYPGASPSEVESGVCLLIEDKLEGLDGIKEMTSSSREGFGSVMLEIDTDANVRKVLDEVKSRVEQVDFPPEAEDYDVVELTLKQHVIHLAIAGDAPEQTLKAIADEIRDEVRDLPEVSQVSVWGVRDSEVVIEVSEQALRRHRLTLAAVAGAIRQSSFDLPAGSLKTDAGKLTLRVVGKLHQAAEYEQLVVMSRPDGTIVRLGDIAAVGEGFADVDLGGQFNGKNAVLVSVFKTADEDTIEIVKAVRAYVDGTPAVPKNALARFLWGLRHPDGPVLGKRAQMPDGITLKPWADYSGLIQDRLDMLVRNAKWGLGLVFLVLWIFLGWRLSLWVAMGIPVAIMGTILVLNLTGMTMNMMSMFALIMALGLIVDDAIVVGENVHAEIERGLAPREAAVRGTRNVLLPVIGAVATTWLAFGALLFIPGIMGRFISILPIAVMTALAFSLLECLVILPPHLSHSLQKRQERRLRQSGREPRFAGVRAKIDGAIRTVINVHFARVYDVITTHRYVAATALLAVFAVVVAAQRTGRIPFTSFPKVDSDTIRAKLVLPTGTSFARTAEVARRISAAALTVNDSHKGLAGQPVVQRVFSLIGAESQGGDAGSHVAEVIVELIPGEDRPMPSEDLINAWREASGPVIDALILKFDSFGGGPHGQALEMRVLGPDIETIQPTIKKIKEKLETFPGVTDIYDDALPGGMEMRISLKDEGYALGLNLRDLAGQLRSAYYGDEPVKIQRGRDEVKVRVRYPESQRRSLGDVEAMRIRTAEGAEIPFLQVANVELERGYTTLRRIGGKRVVVLSADVDADDTNAEAVLGKLTGDGFFKALAKAHPGVKVDLRGQRQQTMDSMDALLVSFPLALLGIYTILAGLFKSYLQPVIIMIVIPFGLVGAVIGHWLTGYDVTLLSLFGMVALTGIVVNDSLVLIDFINRGVRSGKGVFEAAREAALRRFRPIFLTTATTVVGMLPILLEQSFQAQFLKPMVVAIVFGLLFATALTLLVVPSLYLIGNDLRRGLRWLRRGVWPAPEQVLGRSHRPEEPDDAPEAARP